jgi:predicted small secreted protein
MNNQRMKSQKRIALTCAALVLAAITYTSCETGGGNGDGDKQIVMSEQSEQTQHAFADEETTGGFTFTAKSAWTATVTENAASRATNVEWLRLLYEGSEKYSGDAGTFTLVIEIDANYTGQTRSATITITSGGDKITVTVTQDGKTEQGEEPTPSQPFDRTITGQFTPSDGEFLTDVKAVHDGERGEVVLADGEVSAGSFSITLPETVANGNLTLFNVQGNVPVSDPAAKHALATLEVYGTDGKNVGQLGYDKADVQYIYVDRDCRIIGNGEEDSQKFSYSAVFKKGWNAVYTVLNGNTYELSTTKPDGDMIWRVAFYKTTGTRLLR